MNINILIVILDFVLILELWSIALWFTFDLTRRLFLVMAIGFMLASLGVLIVLPGDMALMFGYTPDGWWFLSREFRAIPNRAVWAVGFGIVAAVLRFGKWVK